MDDKIHFEVIGIAEALKRHYYVVPSNQREYSWFKDTQVKEFVADIRNAARNPGTPYFLGTIVLTTGKSDRLEIADGQQRLATTTMILAAIRDWFKAKGEAEFLRSIETDFLFKYDRDQKEDVSKLSMNVDDNEYFKTIILDRQNQKGKKSKNPQSHRRITEAYEYIKAHINNIEKEYGPENAKEILNDLMKYLSKDAKIVKLTVADAENAFLMFETLNDRGLKTSQVDLVKNHVFKNSEDRIKEVEKLWRSMRSAVESVADDDDIMMDFLRGACCIISGPTSKKEVMKKVKEQATSRSETVKMMSLFEELSKDYAAILNPDHQKWNNYDISTRKAISTLNLLGATQIRVLMLSITRNFSPKETATAFRKLVSWTIRFFVMGMGGSRLYDNYARLSNRIYLGEIKTSEQLSKESEKVVIGDAEFGAAFEILTVGPAKIARYYLRALETTARGEPDPEFIPNDDLVINLEHIMPESINDDWKHVPFQDQESHLKRLGNMVLLKAKKNSDAGNLAFKEKRKIYRDSTFLLTKEVSQRNKWDREEIEKRQKKMAELAVQTWAL
ncbi:MAG: DUF262 domain-containing protein [Flavisolibacter sp.]